MRGPAATGWLRVSGFVTEPVGVLTGVLHAGSRGLQGHSRHFRQGHQLGQAGPTDWGHRVSAWSFIRVAVHFLVPPPPLPHAGLGTMPPVSALAGIPQIEGVQEEGPRGPPTSEAVSHNPSVTAMLVNLLPLANSSL